MKRGIQMKTVDLNCDLGESFGNYKCGMDEEILPFITSANVACGFHASDPVVMSKTVKEAVKNHVQIGAHPGFPDLVGFGRRKMDLPPSEITAIIQYQIGALKAFCAAEGIRLQHVKPHGALYNMAVKSPEIAQAICEGIASVDSSLILLAPGSSEMSIAAKRLGLKTANEVFADRAYEEDGSLVARSKPGAMITDKNLAIDRVLQMVEKGTVTSITGKEIELSADSICVHGDSPAALTFAENIRQALTEHNIRIASLEETIREH